ncbi:hypothetical protein Poli38472_004514 [Pythium oligandrum]|uniref:Crinkler effector protein N-terminal domain-containing protein n=1 Tax=Pythium oligandrum TaxID=41045 RepID=A0A8K1FDI2_PYTOL|nr:hypothetical protein Poli38472_004514 [Pythium oligandrum]|eukprot:TMW59445.1 hypothetical protein Poli38472_004514 [Pythium oligandrum]
MSAEVTLSCVVAGDGSAVTLNALVYTRVESIRGAVYFMLGLDALGWFPPTAVKLFRPKKLKGDDQPCEYDEMRASYYVGDYLMPMYVGDEHDADTMHIVVRLPPCMPPSFVPSDQLAPTASAVQAKAKERADRSAKRRSMQKKKHKPARWSRPGVMDLLHLWCAILDDGGVFSIKIKPHATTEELRKRIYHKQQYHRLGEFQHNDLELYVAKTPPGEWLLDDLKVHSLGHDEVRLKYKRITMWSTVDEFYTGKESGVDGEIYVLVALPRFREGGLPLTHLPRSILSAEEEEATRHVARAYEPPCWSFTQWLSSVLDWQSNGEAAVDKKRE